MAEVLEQQQAQPSTHEELGFDERLALLVDREATIGIITKSPGCLEPPNSSYRLILRTSITAIRVDCRKASLLICSVVTGSTSTTMC
jgi:hypothetical protein